MITLDEARRRIGAGVVYRAHPDAQAEDGVIVRVGAPWVFVRYAGDSTPKATSGTQLDWRVRR